MPKAVLMSAWSSQFWKQVFEQGLLTFKRLRESLHIPKSLTIHVVNQCVYCYDCILGDYCPFHVL